MSTKASLSFRTWCYVTQSKQPHSSTFFTDSLSLSSPPLNQVHRKKQFKVAYMQVPGLPGAGKVKRHLLSSVWLGNRWPQTW